MNTSAPVQPPCRPQPVILTKIFSVRLGEDFDCVSLVETHLYQEDVTVSTLLTEG